MSAIFFNLLVNSIFSLVSGLVVVGFFLWIFRVETGGWKLFFLSLPFVKIVYDLARGVPTASVLFSGVDPYSLPSRSQILSVGAGLNDVWSPYIDAIFSVKTPAGGRYEISIGDYLLIWIQRRFGANVPKWILAAVLSVSAALLIRRIFQAWRFERARRRSRTSCVPLRQQPLRWRNVDIYISKQFSGTPFTGGIRKPYICLPSDTVEKLEAEELEAVIAHEMGHIRHFDLPVTVLIQALGDLFWFIPGYRWLSRKIDRLREVVADQAAIASGASALQLASALIKIKEVPGAPPSGVLYSAFVRERSLLKERVSRLLGEFPEKKPRNGWSHRWIRVAVAVIIASSVLTSTIGGNHKASSPGPEWLEHYLKAHGWSD